MRTKTIALAAGGALALTTLGGVAVAVPALNAATTTATADATDDTTDPDAPDAPDAKTEAERLADRTARIAEKLAGLVTDGTITQEQADAVAGTLAEAGPEGLGGPGGHGPHGGPLGDALRQGLATAATTLGLEEDALRERLRAGETLGEVADAEGVDRDDLVAALVAEAEEAVAQRVTDGDLTQAQADKITAGLTERITGGLDREGPGGPGGRGPGGPGGGPKGDDEGATDAPAPSDTPSGSATEGDS